MERNTQATVQKAHSVETSLSNCADFEVPTMAVMGHVKNSIQSRESQLSPGYMELYPSEQRNLNP